VVGAVMVVVHRRQYALSADEPCDLAVGEPLRHFRQRHADRSQPPKQLLLPLRGHVVGRLRRPSHRSEPSLSAPGYAMLAVASLRFAQLPRLSRRPLRGGDAPRRAEVRRREAAHAPRRFVSRKPSVAWSKARRGAVRRYPKRPETDVRLGSWGRALKRRASHTGAVSSSKPTATVYARRALRDASIAGSSTLR